MVELLLHYNGTAPGSQQLAQTFNDHLVDEAGNKFINQSTYMVEPGSDKSFLITGKN